MYLIIFLVKVFLKEIFILKVFLRKLPNKYIYIYFLNTINDFLNIWKCF